MKSVTSSTIDSLEISNLSNNITEDDIRKLFESKQIHIIDLKKQEIKDKANFAITIETKELTLTQIELLKQEKVKNEPLVIKFTSNIEFKIKKENPQFGDLIKYSYEYNKIIKKEFSRKKGDEGLIFINKEVISKQRDVMGYLIKTIGLSLMQGKSVMSISLPINIFDIRSHLEVFASQNSYAKVILDKNILKSDPIERLKISTTFVVTTIHMSVAQLKPFNPIIGETFQTIIDGIRFYLEQTSHHPPISNFYAIGSNFKIYGFFQSEANTGPNSVKCYYKGKFTIEYKDGIKHNIVFPMFQVTGTVFGDRVLNYKKNLIVTDQKNDLIAHINMNPKKKGFISNLFSKNDQYPDYFRGVITSLSQNSIYDKKKQKYTIKDEKNKIISEIEGEYSSYIKFDGKNYWSYNLYECPSMMRMEFTLPSDSTFREDILYLKENDETMSQKAKIILEEKQRYDEKIRKKN